MLFLLFALSGDVEAHLSANIEANRTISVELAYELYPRRRACQGRAGVHAPRDGRGQDREPAGGTRTRSVAAPARQVRRSQARDGRPRRVRNDVHYFLRFSCRFGGSDLCWRAWPMDAAAIVENAGNSGRERRLGKGCEHVQTWSGVFHNRLENASRFPRAPTGPS